jgi:cytochrome c
LRIFSIFNAILMNFLEINKLISAILIALIIVFGAGLVSKLFYRPKYEPFVRGFEVEVTGVEGVASSKKEVNMMELIFSALSAPTGAEAGAKIAKQCVQCHSFGKAEGNKIGPNLWGIVGKKQASKEGFEYSKAFQTLNGVWDYENLSKFINNPAKYAKGTKMSYAGVKKAEDLANVIAYLRENSDSKYPMPKVEKKVEEKKADIKK